VFGVYHPDQTVSCGWEPELQTLLERWTEQLTDQFWSGHQDAAVAIGDALEAYPDTLWSKVRDELIPKIFHSLLGQN